MMCWSINDQFKILGGYAMLKHSAVYKKLGVILAIFLLALFGIRLTLAYEQSRCAYCQAGLEEGQLYIWDCPAGLFTPVAPYLDRQSDVLWFQRDYSLPQMIHTGQGCGVAQFDAQPPASARYCPRHRPPVDGSRFLVLQPQSDSAACIPLREGVEVSWEGLRLVLGHDGQQGGWTVRIFGP